jgi:hypothetical protein
MLTEFGFVGSLSVMRLDVSEKTTKVRATPDSVFNETETRRLPAKNEKNNIITKIKIF